MSTYTQKSRPLSVTTPLGKDVLLLTELSGGEALSQLFHFKLTAMVKNGTDVGFDKLLGQNVTASVELPGGAGKQRHFSGICSRAIEGVRDVEFTSYYLEIVPQAWLLTRKAQSRIFQHKSVPDILKKVFEGFDVTYEIQGSFEPRDYCVQYRETDFNFAARLMEEEGIYYFFKHIAGSHKMVLANTPQSHSEIPETSKVKFETLAAGELRDEDRVFHWEKAQELRAGKYVVWDHSFELPHQHLDAESTIMDSVSAGKVSHKLKLGANGKLELYDFPGEYAQRFDGVDSGGGDRPADLQNIFQDNKRVAEIRMQEEAVPSLVINGSGGCRNFVAGHKFTLEKHFNADGQYVLSSVHHSASFHGDYRSDGGDSFVYRNSFSCFPVALPYRPPRNTPKPIVYGTQTAVVVGQPGDEIFTDKYGRIKVQFHWDRQGKKDANSSCWLRVGTSWAGKQWGAIQLPRVGQEVIVSFQEGDPDQPLVIGSVYNAEQMPPYKLPDNKTQSGMKSRSTLNGTPENFNELRFEDKKGEEQVYFHAEKNFDRVVENNDTLKVGFEKKGKGDQSIEIHNNQKTVIGNSKSDDGSQTIEVWKDRTETVKTGNEKVTIEKGNRSIFVDAGNDQHQIKKGNRTVLIDMGNDALTIKMGNQTTKLNLGKSSTEAMQAIELKVGQSSIVLDQMGVTIKGMMVKVEGQIQTDIKGLMTNVAGSAMLTAKGGLTMIN
jgi:type VI secretion system secreted protein VgrG